MLLRTLIIPALEAQTGPEVFDRCGRSLECFSPRIERSSQAVEVVGFELRLRKCVPCVGIVRRNGDNAPAQFNDCRLVVRLLSCFELGSQLLKARCFCGSQSGASQQSKNGDCKRSQLGARSSL